MPKHGVLPKCSLLEQAIWYAKRNQARSFRSWLCLLKIHDGFSKLSDDYQPLQSI